MDSASSKFPASLYSGFTRVILTSAIPVGGRVPVPLKITSAMRSPRSRRALCSPSTQVMASERLDFPQPFGPTTAATPSANSSRERSAKDLKPSNSSFFSLYKLHLHHFWICDLALKSASSPHALVQRP